MDVIVVAMGIVGIALLVWYVYVLVRGDEK